MKKILVVTCSKDDGKQSKLVMSLNEMKEKVSLVINANNSDGLSKAYNKQIVSENLIKHDIVLFAHDDVYIDDLKLQGKLYAAINNLKYDIVGLAGTSQIEVKKPCLWHRMSDPKNWSGAVSHPVNQSKVSVSTFGVWPERCLVMDGLFLAVNLQRALETGWKFNENYKYHHYDISSCLDANRKRLRMGTYPIWVTHDSPGLRDINDTSFKQSEETFYNEYKQ